MSEREMGDQTEYDLKKAISKDELDKHIAKYDFWTKQCNDCVHQHLYADECEEPESKIKPNENTCPVAAIFKDEMFLQNRFVYSLNEQLSEDQVAWVAKVVGHLMDQVIYWLFAGPNGEMEKRLCYMFFPRVISNYSPSCISRGQDKYEWSITDVVT